MTIQMLAFNHFPAARIRAMTHTLFSEVPSYDCQQAKMFFFFSCTTLHGLSVNMEPHQQQQSRNPRLLFPPEIQPEIVGRKSCLCLVNSNWILSTSVPSVQRPDLLLFSNRSQSKKRIWRSFPQIGWKPGMSGVISNSNNMKKNFQLK